MGELEERIAHLERAVERRTTIGVALGILMERLDLSRDEAFAYMQHVSTHQNRKLYDLCSELIDTRTLPAAATTNGKSPAGQRPRGTL